VYRTREVGNSIDVPQQLQRESGNVPNRNDPVVDMDGVRSMLEKLKLETAQELGIQNYESLDKGSISAKVNGTIGGYVTKKLVALGMQTLAKQGQWY
jgi:small acid-soluble spore protein A (major alpha-type SASP)